MSKHTKSGKRTKRTKCTKRTKRASRHHKKSTRKNVQLGGDPGAPFMPMEYYGGSNKHYFEGGSPELNNSDVGKSVSQGMISADGKTAGPDLYPTMQTLPGSMSGGGRRRSRRHKKSKRRQSGGGYACGGATNNLAGNYMPGRL
jgi:hypothetical protein